MWPKWRDHAVLADMAMKRAVRGYDESLVVFSMSDGLAAGGSRLRLLVGGQNRGQTRICATIGAGIGF
tara:strand:- start:178156 stop:178359 length:204 start_codon:yes stop_codon:yes gene_type:complete